MLRAIHTLARHLNKGYYLYLGWKEKDLGEEHSYAGHVAVHADLLFCWVSTEKEDAGKTCRPLAVWPCWNTKQP
jgi:hypothetical protein